MEQSPSQSLLKHYIHEFSLGDHLNTDLLRGLRLFRYPPGTELYSQAGEQWYVYLLVAGQVQVNVVHPNGKLAVLALLSPLAVLGDLELFSDDTLQTNVVTTEASVLLGIEKALVLRCGWDDPRFLRFVIHHLTTKLYQTSLRQTGNVLPLSARLAAYLIAQPSTPDGLILLPARASLAGLLDTSPRHLNRVIKDLESATLIWRDRQRVRILDRAGLARWADAE